MNKKTKLTLLTGTLLFVLGISLSNINAYSSTPIKGDITTYSISLNMENMYGACTNTSYKEVNINDAYTNELKNPISFSGIDIMKSYDKKYMNQLESGSGTFYNTKEINGINKFKVVYKDTITSLPSLYLGTSVNPTANEIKNIESNKEYSLDGTANYFAFKAKDNAVNIKEIDISFSCSLAEKEEIQEYVYDKEKLGYDGYDISKDNDSYFAYPTLGANSELSFTLYGSNVYKERPDSVYKDILCSFGSDGGYLYNNYQGIANLRYIKVSYISDEVLKLYSKDTLNYDENGNAINNLVGDLLSDHITYLPSNQTFFKIASVKSPTFIYSITFGIAVNN